MQKKMILRSAKSVREPARVALEIEDGRRSDAALWSAVASVSATPLSDGLRVGLGRASPTRGPSESGVALTLPAALQGALRTEFIQRDWLNCVITEARLATFIKIPAFPKIILRFIEDLNPHLFCASSRAFTSSHS